MDVATILELISQGSKLVKVISEVVSNASTALSEDDQKVLQERLSKLQAENDASFNRISAKLDVASKRF